VKFFLLLLSLSGTFHGYSALCIAKALPSEGQVFSIDSSLHSHKAATRNLQSLAADMATKVKFVHAKATDFMQSHARLMKGMFMKDSILIDKELD
jgi:predicted O-methyltransferase YrrM